MNKVKLALYTDLSVTEAGAENKIVPIRSIGKTERLDCPIFGSNYSFFTSIEGSCGGVADTTSVGIRCGAID